MHAGHGPCRIRLAEVTYSVVGKSINPFFPVLYVEQILLTQGSREPTSKIRGVVKYPWGTLSGAKIVAGDKSASSDNNGAYEVSGLTPGIYHVDVRPPFPGYEASSQRVELAADETKLLDIYIDFETTVVEGYVTDQDGKAIKGATLSGILSGEKMGTMTTDEQGYFKFQRVTPGDRFVRVNARGYMGETRDFKASQDNVTTLGFRLAPATCKICGTVTDDKDQRLQAEIRLLKSGVILQNTSSNEAGYYEFDLGPGLYQVLATAPGYDIEPWQGSISGDLKVDFRLKPHHASTEYDF
jgi:hypothetical protein